MPHNDLIQSLLRGVDILEFVARQESGVTLREISDTLGLKQPTAHNLVRTLISRGFLEKSEHPIRYRLGTAATRLATDHHSHALLGEGSQTLLWLGQEVDKVGLRGNGRTPEVQLGLARPVGGEVVQLLRLRLPGPFVVARSHHPHHPYSSAVSNLYQAYCGQLDRDRYQRNHSFIDLGRDLWDSREQFERFLARVRRVGYCRPPFYPTDHLRLAAPVLGVDGRMLAMLGMMVESSLPRADVRRLTRLLIQAAATLSDSIAGAGISSAVPTDGLN
jgi:DNA-binding IclR family transcriptional regulator